MTLYDSLSKIAEQIQSQRSLITSEQATILVSIQPFIRALGYDTQNLAEVQPEYTADPHSSGTERVDYVIKRDGKPIVLIEVKSANTTLNQHHWKQLHSYFVSLDVEFGVLTNGLEYRFFTDTKKPNVMDEEPFLTIDMLKLDASQVNILEGFSKARFAPEQTLRKIKISNLLDKELNQPSDDFVKHFARQVHSGSIWQTVIEEFRPLLKRAWDDLVDQKIARRVRPYDGHVEESPKVKAPTSPPPPETESLSPTPAVKGSVEIPIYGYWRRRRVEATLLINAENPRRSKVRYEGQLVTPSKAGELFKRSIDSSITGATNGWSFWYFDIPGEDIDPKIGELRTDTDLVRRLLSGD